MYKVTTMMVKATYKLDLEKIMKVDMQLISCATVRLMVSSVYMPTIIIFQI